MCSCSTKCVVMIKRFRSDQRENALEALNKIRCSSDSFLISIHLPHQFFLSLPKNPIIFFFSHSLLN